MSRSKKQPYHNTVCMGRGAMKWWKTQCNRKIRHMPADEDVYGVKKQTDRWSAPDDGKIRDDEPEHRRK